MKCDPICEAKKVHVYIFMCLRLLCDYREDFWIYRNHFQWLPSGREIEKNAVEKEGVDFLKRKWLWQAKPTRGPREGQTWHDDLWEAQLPGHHSGPVHQVWVVLADLNDVTHKHLHGHPEAWKGMITMKSQLQGVLMLTLPPYLPLGSFWRRLLEAEKQSQM